MADHTSMGWDHEPTLRRFEAAWRAGPPPRIDDFLPLDGDARRDLLVELACTDLEYRLKTGEPARVEEYRDRYPFLADDETAILDLIGVEFGVRQRLTGVAATEYVERFPQYRDRLPTDADRRSTRANSVNIDHQSTSNELPAIPGYEVLSVLGRGGMGIVYRARHVGLNRIVAVKMLLAGRGEDPEAVDRFRAEAEAVARLQDPHVVQVFDVGESGGRPFFAMEFVPGGSLAEALAGTPQPARVAASLVATVARAVDTAHRAGIVHRDLKPANVLLANGGTLGGQSRGTESDHSLLTPKVTDFGLAKRLDSSGLTHTGSVLGTPSYMAPEQAGGRTRDVGPAADVYALGAILYECLTGRPPFKAATAWETIKQVLADDPVPPTRLQPAVPSDLETVCLKCLEKEPGRRYPTASAFADDLDRFVRCEPVQARPVSAVERVWRWSRRNPRVAGLTTALFATLLAGLVTALALLQLAEARRVAAEAASDQLRLERAASEESFQQARAAVVESFVLATDDPVFRADGMQPAREKLLRTSLKYFRAFAERRADDPALLADVADARHRAGKIIALLGAGPEALAEFDLGLAAVQRLLRDQPDDANLIARAVRILGDSAALNKDMGRHGESERRFREATRLARLLSTARSNDPRAAEELGRVLSGLAGAIAAAGRPADALPVYEEGRSVLNRPDLAPDGLRARGGCLNDLGQTYQRLGKVTEAVAAYRDAIATRERLHALVAPEPADRNNLARYYGSLGLSLDALGEREPSSDAFRKAIAIREPLVRDNPRVPEFSKDLAISYICLGDNLGQEGRNEERVALQQKAVDLLVGKAEAFPTNVELHRILVNAHINLSLGLRELGNAEAALKHLDLARTAGARAIDLAPGVPEHRLQLAYCHTLAGEYHRKANRFELSFKEYDAARVVLDELMRNEPRNPQYRRELAMTLANLSWLHGRLGRREEGLRTILRVFRLRSELVRDYPKVPELAASLERTRSDAAAVAKAFVDQVIAVKEGSTEARATAQTVLARLAAEYPDVAALATELSRLRMAPEATAP